MFRLSTSMLWIGLIRGGLMAVMPLIFLTSVATKRGS